MGRYSILPTSWETFETWVARAFLLFAVLTLGPWILIFVYDFLLYLVRYILWEIPVVGGKARGQHPPEPAQLIEHATGLKRSNSITEPLSRSTSRSGSKTTGTTTAVNSSSGVTSRT